MFHLVLRAAALRLSPSPPPLFVYKGVFPIYIVEYAARLPPSFLDAGALLYGMRIGTHLVLAMTHLLSRGKDHTTTILPTPQFFLLVIISLYLCLYYVSLIALSPHIIIIIIIKNTEGGEKKGEEHQPRRRLTSFTKIARFAPPPPPPPAVYHAFL